MGISQRAHISPRPASIGQHRGQFTTNRSGLCPPKRAFRTMATAPPQLWALDFDGVACDSCGESALSAWKVGPPSTAPRIFLSLSHTQTHKFLQAASKLWPERFSSQDALDRKDQLIEDMRAVRPVVETGYVCTRCALIYLFTYHYQHIHQSGMKILFKFDVYWTG